LRFEVAEIADGKTCFALHSICGHADLHPITLAGSVPTRVSRYGIIVRSLSRSSPGFFATAREPPPAVARKLDENSRAADEAVREVVSAGADLPRRHMFGEDTGEPLS